MQDAKLTQQAEALALADYQKAIGTALTVRMLTGYKGDDSYDFDSGEYLVRVTDTPEDDLNHWVDEYLDPYWNVEIVGNHPELEGYRSFWTFGPSYQIAEGKVVSAENNQVVSHDH